MPTQPQQFLGITLFIVIVLFCSTPLASSQEPQSQKPIIVRVHRQQGQLVFKLEPDPTPGKDILWGLSALVKQHGQNYPVLALVDDSAKISDIDQVPGIAAKAGFGNVRTFIVRHATGKMVEIKVCSAFPISTNPPRDSACASTK